MGLFLEQSHPDQHLIDDSLNKVPLKQTTTPIVLFKTHPYKKEAVAKVCELPDNEIEESFVTLVILLKHADKRRRETFCKNGCSHEWHNIDKEAKKQSKRC